VLQKSGGSTVPRPSSHFDGREETSGAELSSLMSDPELPPLGDDQKRFNSEFYSLCSTGSNRSITDRTDRSNILSNGTRDSSVASSDDKPAAKVLMHTCRTGSKSDCKKCESLQTMHEFDNISRQIESLSRTVSELHHSLSSLNSEISDVDLGSNEGDVSPLQTCNDGPRELDGYHWAEDEMFLSPYSGETILMPYDGDMCLSDTPLSLSGASCDLIQQFHGAGGAGGETRADCETKTLADRKMDDESEKPSNGVAFDIDSVEVGERDSLLESSLVFDIPMNQTSQSLHKIASCTKNTISTSSSPVLANCLDEAGNFNSQSFISQRLQKEEERLKNLDPNSHKSLLYSQDIDVSASIQSLRSSLTSSFSSMKSRDYGKGDNRLSKDTDLNDAEDVQNQVRPKKKSCVSGNLTLPIGTGRP